MRHTLVALAALAAAVTQSAAAPVPQCWANGAAIPCPAPPSAAGTPTNQPVYRQVPRQYPPEWYYNPYDVPWQRCHLCGQ